MLAPEPIGTTAYASAGSLTNNETSVSGVSWAAVFAGGVSAAAVSIILGLLGFGLGMSSISPWPHSGVSAGTFTVLAAIWLVIVQWVSSIFGGYMAGRLRTKWSNVHTDEVFFRDTAHGFLAWALATVLVVGMLASGLGSAVTGGAKVAADAAPAVTSNNYYVDELFRQTPGTAPAPASAAMATGLSDQETRRQANVILATGANSGQVAAADNAYLVQLVSGRTGLAPADAQTRVNDVLAQEQAAAVKAKQVANDARKATASAAIFTFISMLIGAFIASVSGAIGGRLRDTY